MGEDNVSVQKLLMMFFINTNLIGETAWWGRNVINPIVTAILNNLSEVTWLRGGGTGI